MSPCAPYYPTERVDLVHLHSPVAGGQAVPALAARLAGVSATLATYHQIQPRGLPGKSCGINYLTHVALVDRTMAVSHGVRESLVAAAGLPARRVRVIANGIDPAIHSVGTGDLPTRTPGEVWQGYFGRLSPEKGLSGLLAALALLAPICPEARTLIVGEGPERANLETVAARLGIADRVRFLGFRADACRIMEQVDIVVHVPVYEGFGLVLLEAMAAGRPVVANDAPGGVSEVVSDGETGLIVPAGSREALSRALARLVVDPAERTRLGRNGRARWRQHFSARGMVEQIAALYEESLGCREHATFRRRPHRRSILNGTSTRHSTLAQH